MSDRQICESEQSYQARMGDELGSVFYHIVILVYRLHEAWGSYVTLFGSESRVSLLNKAAPQFFGGAQEIFLDAIFLHISRLTDAAQMGKRENLSIMRLSAMIDRPETTEELAPLLKDLADASKAFRGWRNLRIAHNDYDQYVGKRPAPLPVADKATTRKVIQLLREIVQTIGLHYMNTTIHLGDAEDEESVDARCLLHVMHDGLLMDRHRLERRKAGEYRPDLDGPVDL